MEPVLNQPLALFRRIGNGMSAESRGIVLILMSTATFTAMHATIRHVTEGLHPFETAFFRNLFGLVVLAPVFFREGLAPLRTERIKLHALRGGLQTVAMLCFFTALSIAPLAQVTALSFTAPLFAALGAALILGEVMRIRRWTALIIGFVGALIIIRPGIIEIDFGTVLTLVASSLWAIAMLVIKSLSRTDSSVTVTLYMGIFLTPLTFIAALTVWTWPTPEQLLWLMLIATFGTVGHLCMAQAFREADASVVLPFDFTRLIWASVFAFVFFTELPDLWTWVGGAVIFSAATYIAYRESRLKDKKVEPGGNL